MAVDGAKLSNCIRIAADLLEGRGVLGVGQRAHLEHGAGRFVLVTQNVADLSYSFSWHHDVPLLIPILSPFIGLACGQVVFLVILAKVFLGAFRVEGHSLRQSSHVEVLLSVNATKVRQWLVKLRLIVPDALEIFDV